MSEMNQNFDPSQSITEQINSIKANELRSSLMSQQADRKQQGDLTVGHQTHSVNKSDLNKSPKDQHNIDQAFIFQGPLRDLDSTSPVAFEFVMNNF